MARLLRRVDSLKLYESSAGRLTLSAKEKGGWHGGRCAWRQDAGRVANRVRQQVRTGSAKRVVSDLRGLEKAIVELGGRIAELKAQVADAVKNAEEAEALRGETAALKEQGESNRIDFSCSCSGCST